MSDELTPAQYRVAVIKSFFLLPYFGIRLGLSMALDRFDWWMILVGIKYHPRLSLDPKLKDYFWEYLN